MLPRIIPDIAMETALVAGGEPGGPLVGAIDGDICACATAA